MNDDMPGARKVERRQYYRINDVVELRYTVPDQGEDINAGSDVGVSTGTLLAELDDEIARAINLVWGDDPVAGRALGLLNRKISVLASVTMTNEGVEPASYEEARVSLSGCGMAFGAAEYLAPETRLRLELILRPSGIAVAISGRVVSTEERAGRETPWWVRLDFDDDHQAREQLIQHVVQKQGMLLSEPRD